MSRKLNADEIELLDSIQTNFDVGFDRLTDWEQRFTEDILERYDTYGINMFVSPKQVELLMKIGEKLL